MQVYWEYSSTEGQSHYTAFVNESFLKKKNATYN